ncbi:uncharacterized protein BP5553_09214 [Venustampulla echinocandica]|uniref:Uncharacterized protein n=1 Tax=Venustampulla echinocandica TaxID=2656787 RepID=A0A370TC49_9HELO|nr:uncharacterized protein BP5553_09214 [Venustampulla echinocandica]RDL31812.1 hypothetical protein BP5553_09214 [Venustampulla echinocandica]
MSQDMDWSLTFCLACDRQTDGNNAYCGEGCRLADCGRANAGSEARSPPPPQASISGPLKPSNNSDVPSGDNFTKRPSTSSSRSKPQILPIYVKPILTPSSPQSSHSSSTPSKQVQLSDKARRELGGYATDFSLITSHLATDSCTSVEEARETRATKEITKGKGKRGRMRKSAALEEDEPVPVPVPVPWKAPVAQMTKAQVAED